MTHFSGSQRAKFPTNQELTPTQQDLVFGGRDGEYVVGGGAGTGKTAAAIHRALQLLEEAGAGRGKPVLFLTFTRSLSAATRSVIESLTQGSGWRIDVCSMHSAARRYMDPAIQSWSVVKGAAQWRYVEQAIREVKQATGGHSVFDSDSRMFLDQIGFIKGSGFNSSADYINAARALGSRRPDDELEIVLRVATAYDELLRANKRLDWDDFAASALQRRGEQGYPALSDHVIVDEAQDLTTSQIELVRSLARRSILLIADQGQTIYGVRQEPGTLPPEGEYDALLNVNFRNADPIRELAERLRADATSEAIAQPGEAVSFQHFRYVDDEAEYVAGEIERLREAGRPNDTIAVLAPTWEGLNDITSALRSRGIPYAADGNRGVLAMTIHQAKGRAFNTVFVPGLIQGILPRLMPDMDLIQQQAEVEHARRLLYVAIGRARRRLVLSHAEGDPSRYLYELGLVGTS